MLTLLAVPCCGCNRPLRRRRRLSRSSEPSAPDDVLGSGIAAMPRRVISATFHDQAGKYAGISMRQLLTVPPVADAIDLRAILGSSL